MDDDICARQYAIHIVAVAQVALTNFTTEFRYQFSTIAAGCDKMQVSVTDLCQFFEHMTTDEAGRTGDQDGVSHKP